MRRRSLTTGGRAQQQQYCSGSWFVTWTTSIFILLQLSSMASATITVTETGQRFPSRPDHLVGQKFEDGFEYMARLQYIHSNLNLCPHNNNTIQVPNDGLPVALLAKSGGCSYEEKALFASLNIHPQNNIVKYIIIFDDETRPILSDEKEDNDDDIDLDDDMILELKRNLLLSNLEETEPSMVLSSPASSFSFLDQQYDTAAAAAATASSPTTTTLGGLHHRSKKRSHHNDNVSVGVLLISKHTGLELLRMLVKDTYENRVLGGPRIIVDGKNWRDRARSIMLWVGVSIFSIACVCGCILVAQPDDFFIIRGETTTQPTRPTRRRLTVEEVQEHLPEIEFDGSQLLFGGCVESKDEHDNNGGEGEPQQGTTNNTSSLLNNRSILDSECSICLDDYHPGEMLRSLPCGHTFHSDCITKWLTERSAVCPLCKAELVVVEDDEESDEDDEAESYASGGDYVEMRDNPPPSDTNNDDGDDDTAAAAASLTQTAPPPSRSSWWRSLFSRRHHSHRQQLLSSEATDQQQNEPLLPESTDDDEQVQEGQQQSLPLGEAEQQQQPLLEQSQSNNNVEETLV